MNDILNVLQGVIGQESPYSNSQELWVPNSCEEEAGPFPTETLPGTFGEMVREVAKVRRVDEGLPGVVMLGSLASALGNRVQGELLPGYTTPSNLYVLGVAPSGYGKSSVASPILAPLRHALTVLDVPPFAWHAPVSMFYRCFNPRSLRFSLTIASCWRVVFCPGV